MGERVRPSEIYREHNIVFNPSGKQSDALLDLFSVHEPTNNPAVASLIYMHPSHQAKKYDTEDAARAAAMSQARAWIDTRLS